MKASLVQGKDHIEIQTTSKSILIRDSCFFYVFDLFGLISPGLSFFLLLNTPHWQQNVLQ